jgi:peptide/nickel transport system substrate-binding protein
MAFDRATIAREFFNDIATPLYMGSFFPSDPNWQAKWEVKYDPAAAEALLDEAGFPKKANGTRFDMPIFGDSGNELFTEMSEVAAGELRKIGINTSVLHYAYASFRPTMVQRSNTIPVTMTCRQNNGGAPWDWPRLEEYSSITRGGFGCGIEDPHVAEVYQQVAVETDIATRIQMNNDLADYWYDQMFEPGLVSVPEAVAYNPKSISAWDMRPGIFLVVNSPENIVLAR